MKIAVVGSGYVGLVTGVCLADFGHDVVCIDNDAVKIEGLRKGIVPIYEPGLEALLEANVQSGRLAFTANLPSGIGEADVVFIAVGTPSRRGDGHADLDFVYQAAREVAKSVRGFTVIATKSTVPVGTGDEVARILRATNPQADAVVVSNPEFLREGAAINDFKRPDRIVVGIEDERAREVMAEVYRPLYLNQAPILFTGRRTAELIKYAANAFLAMKVTFINEMADLCEAAGADVQDLARGLGLDNRIGTKFLHPGPGYGGSCFPKDTRALVRIGEDFGSPMHLVAATASINDRRKQSMALKVAKACGGDVRGKAICVLGLTFKPNTDDMREAPSIDLIHGLQGMGANIVAYDPHGMEAARDLFEGVKFAATAYDAAQDADAIVLVTEWDEFRSLDLNRLRAAMKGHAFVDLRNVYPPQEVQRHGFSYTGIGRGIVPAADGAPHA